MYIIIEAVTDEGIHLNYFYRDFQYRINLTLYDVDTKEVRKYIYYRSRVDDLRTKVMGYSDISFTFFVITVKDYMLSTCLDFWRTFRRRHFFDKMVDDYTLFDSKPYAYNDAVHNPFSYSGIDIATIMQYIYKYKDNKDYIHIKNDILYINTRNDLGKYILAFRIVNKQLLSKLLTFN